MPKILIIVTNYDGVLPHGKKTGWYAPEVAHPYHEFTKANYSVDFARYLTHELTHFSVLTEDTLQLTKEVLRTTQMIRSLLNSSTTRIFKKDCKTRLRRVK